MKAICYSFENNSVRTLGTPDLPLFVALDVSIALGYKNPKVAATQHVDPEDLIKAEIETKGGRQTVNCVNESGLYALIFGSKLESAKRFKRWVTSEVLPEIRKTGRYEYTQGERNCDQYMIRKAVAKRAKANSVHYQTIYNALYDRFHISSYKQLRHDQIGEALTFIEIFPLKTELPKSAPEQKIEQAPGSVVLTDKEVTALLTFIYYWTRLFRKPLELFYNMLDQTNSPYAAQFYEAFQGMRLCDLERRLAAHGRKLSELKCYQYWLTSEKSAA